MRTAVRICVPLVVATTMGVVAGPAPSSYAEVSAPGVESAAGAESLPVGVNRRVSVRADRTPARQPSGEAVLSADGRYAAFVSADPRMIPGQRILGPQVYRRDLRTGVTALVSHAPDGSPSEGGVGAPDISADGSLIVFDGTAFNLEPGTDGFSNVYAWDAASQDVEIVSTSPTGAPGSTGSRAPSVSADGRYVAYESSASNLDPGSPRVPGFDNIYRYDAAADRSRLVSVGYAGQGAIGDSFDADISADGARIAFTSTAENLDPLDDSVIADAYLFDAATVDITLVSRAAGGGPYPGVKSDAVISDDGRYVVFDSTASRDPADPVLPGVSNVYRYAVQTQAIEMVTRSAGGGAGDGDSGRAAVSADGTRIAFSSAAENLVSGGANGVTDVFWYDVPTGLITLVSEGLSGPADRSSFAPAIAAGGGFVIYPSAATNLVAGDTNGVRDVFLQRIR